MVLTERLFPDSQAFSNKLLGIFVVAPIALDKTDIVETGCNVEMILAKIFLA